VRTEGSGLGSPKEPPVLGVRASGVVKVDVGVEEKKLKEQSQPLVGGMVRFIVGCTDSEEEENGEDYDRETDFMKEPFGLMNTAKTMLRRCGGAHSFAERKRLQSESSSGVSTHFSSTSSGNSSNCSIVSGLSSEADVEDDSDPVVCRSAKLNTSMDMASQALATNEGVVVEPFPLTECLVVNPAPSVEIVWSYTVVGGILVANAPSSIQKKAGLNDALVTLLEYGENELHCSRAVILVERNSPDKEALQRMFSFLGFTPLKLSATPGSLRPYTRDHFLMITDFSDLEENDSDLDLED
jgi:hypothetical protein